MYPNSKTIGLAKEGKVLPFSDPIDVASIEKTELLIPPEGEHAGNLVLVNGDRLAVTYGAIVYTARHGVLPIWIIDDDGQYDSEERYYYIQAFYERVKT